MSKGVPQGSILGPILFSVFMNDLDRNVQAKLHLYTDDPVVYTQASTIAAELQECQAAFQASLNTPVSQKLVLNTQKQKKKVYGLPKSSGTPHNCGLLFLDGKSFERVSSYKYLGIDDKLPFNVHITARQEAQSQAGLLFQKQILVYFIAKQ